MILQASFEGFLFHWKHVSFYSFIMSTGLCLYFQNTMRPKLPTSFDLDMSDIQSKYTGMGAGISKLCSTDLDTNLVFCPVYIV